MRPKAAAHIHMQQSNGWTARKSPCNAGCVRTHAVVNKGYRPKAPSACIGPRRRVLGVRLGSDKQAHGNDQELTAGHVCRLPVGVSDRTNSRRFDWPAAAQAHAVILSVVRRSTHASVVLDAPPRGVAVPKQRHLMPGWAGPPVLEGASMRTGWQSTWSGLSHASAHSCRRRTIGFGNDSHAECAELPTAAAESVVQAPDSFIQCGLRKRCRCRFGLATGL